jgi:hypothetical protein
MRFHFNLSPHLVDYILLWGSPMSDKPHSFDDSIEQQRAIGCRRKMPSQGNHVRQFARKTASNRCASDFGEDVISVLDTWAMTSTDRGERGLLLARR